MQEIFADTFYWIALANPADASHQAARAVELTNPDSALITTDEVLCEFLNYFADTGERKRRIVTEMFEQAMKHPNIEVLPQTRESLLRGFELYKARIRQELQPDRLHFDGGDAQAQHQRCAYP